MTEKILKCNNIRVYMKKFHNSNQPIELMSVNVDQIVYLTNLSIITKALNVLLVTKKVKSLNRYTLSYLK